MNLNTNPKGIRHKGSNEKLAMWMQEKLETIVREKGTTAVCAAVCAEGGLLAAACAGTRGFDESGAEVGTGEPYIEWLREQIAKPAGRYSCSKEVPAGEKASAGNRKELRYAYGGKDL